MLALLPALALAQPATAPASQQAPRVVVAPPGFVTIEADGVRFLTEPADESIVRTALAGVAPATMPATRPTDLLTKLDASRDQLRQRIITDIALTDPAPVDAFLTKLRDALIKHRDIKPPMIFLVTSETRLKDLLRAGWTDPRFYYNRAADSVEVNWNLNITFDRTPDESLVPAIYPVNASPDERKKKIAESVRVMEERLAGYLANHAADDCYNGFMEFLLAQIAEPVRNKADREWIAAGLCGVLTCRYASSLTGRDLTTMLTQLSSDRPEIPLRQATVNLIQPLEPSQIRAGARELYLLVYTRKAIRVCNEWVTQAGDAAIPKLITELRKNPPADGAALIAQIKQVSGVDLTANVSSGR